MSLPERNEICCQGAPDEDRCIFHPDSQKTICKGPLHVILLCIEGYAVDQAPKGHRKLHEEVTL